jgi:glycosyltransferase 2 family protein
MKRAARLGIQLLASVALMWALLSTVGIEQVVGKLVLHNPAAASLAVVLLAVQLVAAMLRWRMVCAALGVQTRGRGVTLGWVGMGHALSQVLPSSVGGDGYRVLALGRRAGFGAAARTVIADRVAGLLTLSALALPMSIAAIPHTAPSIAFSALAILSGALLAAGVAAGGLARLVARWTASRHAAAVAMDFATMCSRATLLPVFGISAAIHVFSMSVVICLSAALALDEVLWWQAALVVPGTLLVAAIPLSLGGWGIRESSMVFGLAAFGVSEAAALALSISYGLATAAAGVIGLGFWIAGGRRAAPD